MTKANAAVELGQPGLGRGRSRLGAYSELHRGPPQQHRIAGRVGRGDEQQLAGLLGQGRHSPPEALFEGTRQGHRARELEADDQLGRRQSPRQFEQGERVAAGFRQRSGPERGGRVLPGKHRVEEGARHRRRASRQCARSGKPSRCSTRSPRREDQGHRFRARAGGPRTTSTSAEAKSSHCWSSTRQISGLLLRRPQTAGSRPPTRPETGRQLARRSSPKATLGAHRPAAPGRRSSRSSIGRAQLVHPGERQFHLRLDAGGAGHPTAGGVSRPGTQAARSFPTPASPYSTRARLSPFRTAATSPSRTLRSARRSTEFRWTRPHRQTCGHRHGHSG